MKLKSNQPKATAEQVVKDIRRATRRHYSTEDKIRVVLSGLRGEDSIAELCRKEGIAQGLYYSWSKEFLEAGKKRLAGDTARAANGDEVRAMRSQTQALEEAVADLTLENRLLKKSMIRDGVMPVNRFPQSPAILNGLRLIFVKGDNTLYSSNKTLEYDECKTHRTARCHNPCPVHRHRSVLARSPPVRHHRRRQIPS